MVFFISLFFRIAIQIAVYNYTNLVTFLNFFIAIRIDVFYYSCMEKKHVTFRIDPAIIKKLKFLAVEQDRSLTDLFLEAIQELLKKYDKSN